MADETEKKINAAREEYRPVAARGSVLYFLVVEMASVNCMYQTSLTQFLERFDISMERCGREGRRRRPGVTSGMTITTPPFCRSQKNPITAKRIGFIIDYLTLDVFRFKCRGLYENDKFLFVLLMALKVDLQTGHISPEEFQTFLKGEPEPHSLHTPGLPPAPDTVVGISSARRRGPRPQVRGPQALPVDHGHHVAQPGAAVAAEALRQHPGPGAPSSHAPLCAESPCLNATPICVQVVNNEKGWRAWYDKEAPENDVFPDGYHSLDVFRKLLVVR